MTESGRSIFFSSKPSISACASIAGPKEGKGRFGDLFDIVLEEDLLGQISWEMGESEMLRRTAELCCKKIGLSISDAEAFLSGDLNKQIIASTFAARALEVPFFGLYGACSTFVESLLLGAMLVDGGYRKNALCAASSHFCTAERQFRYPLELGTQRPPSAQWTATAAGAVLVSHSSAKSIARITAGTIGKVVDRHIKDANHMGAAMAPAVCDTICAHFKGTNTTHKDYDLIATGDLGWIGKNILMELLKEHDLQIPDEKLIDCGASMYYAEQDTHAGGSGAGCIAAVTCAKLLREIEDSRLKRILIVGSGALLSWTSSQQGESIPGIAYAAVLEGEPNE